MQKEPLVADQSYVVVSALLILLVSAYCVGAAVPAISFVSKLAFYGICFLLCFYVFVELLASGGQLYLKGGYLFYLSFFVLVFWIFLRADNIKGLFLAFQTLLLLLLVVVFDSKRVAFLRPAFLAFRLSGFILLLISASHFYGFKFFENNNYLGPFAFVYFFIFLGGRHWFDKVIALTFLAFVVLSGTRSVFLGLLVGAGAVFLLRRSWLFRIFSIAGAGAVFLYFNAVGLFDYLISSEFSQFLLDTTGKRAESGRFEIWGSIFDSMTSLDYLIGLGGQVNYADIIGADLSPHSGFIYMLSSYGFVGLLLFLVMLIAAVARLILMRSYFCIAIVLGFISREFFEVTLVHNSFPLAVIFWAIVGCGYIGARDSVVNTK